MSTQMWGEDSDCADDKEKPANAGVCPSSCQRDIDCLIASCSDCAVVDVVCDEEIDTAAYPHLASQATDENGTPQKYSDLDLADVPAEKKLQAPFGDSGLFDTMSLWGPDGCAYPYYGYLPDEPLCKDCSSMFEAKEDVLNGLWDGPCNDDDPPGDDDSLPLPPGEVRLTACRSSRTRRRRMIWVSTDLTERSLWVRRRRVNCGGPRTGGRPAFAGGTLAHPGYFWNVSPRSIRRVI